MHLKNKNLRPMIMVEANVCLLDEEREKRLFRQARHDFENGITLADEKERKQ